MNLLHLLFTAIAFLSVTSINLCSVPSLLHSSQITISTSSTNLLIDGYDNCNMKSNGELSVIKYLIKPGYIVFDIGANKGEWSQHVISMQPNVNIYAFEPIPDIFKILETTIDGPHTKCFNVAIAMHNGTQSFFYYNKDRLSSLHRRSEDIERKVRIKPTVISVTTKNLETICQEENIQHIDFLKIDTEGAELEIFQGAITLLKNKAVSIIQFEYGGTYQDAGITLKQVYELLTRYEYEIFRITGKGLIPITCWNNNLENFKYSNYLAVIKD